MKWHYCEKCGLLVYDENLDKCVCSEDNEEDCELVEDERRRTAEEEFWENSEF